MFDDTFNEAEYDVATVPMLTDSARDAFTKRFNALSAEANKAESESNVVAADKHIEVSALTARFHDEYSLSLAPSDRALLQREVFARCMQALSLRSAELSGLGDLALSLGEKRKLEEDLRAAKRRIVESGDSSDNGVQLGDPRKPNGLYEFTPLEDLKIGLDDLPGYETQHGYMLKSYFVLADTSDVSETVAKKALKYGSNILLHGPPGTGKTAAAMAMAKSLELDYVFVNVENLLSAYRSESEKNLRNLYAYMRELTAVRGRNVLLLMDEVDGLVKSRSSGSLSGADYSVLTRFLTILEPNDGKTDNSSVCSVFTTNRVDNIDDAFRRRCAEVFFGRLGDENARSRLCARFFERALDATDRTPEVFQKLANGPCSKWVPGDYVRFSNEKLQPFRLRTYLRANNTSETKFLKQFAPRGNDRVIQVPLPTLSKRDIEQLCDDYDTITSDSVYNELYAKWDS
ncbi:cell division control protein 48-like [Pseudomyrmex gracilis]|uniref:cell division control protein 48-like n=1 Tax=Pseudomyrmex gracilis TaxID=219809 RepID=UPI000994EB53|nr:cell division control protein 48-like [Pseudomyrmex gracilis]